MRWPVDRHATPSAPETLMPNTIATETLFEGQYLRLKRQGHWEYAERCNAGCAVIVVALTPENKLLFVEQYRIPIAARSIEMPAGLVGDLSDTDAIEPPARREQLEDTGWQAETERKNVVEGTRGAVRETLGGCRIK